MWSFPTLEPVILSQGSFAIERMLPLSGEVIVAVGDRIDANQVIAQSDDVEQTVTLYVASELGVENSELSKYVSKSIGSSVSTGDVIARVRRGLRTATVKAPTDGRLVSVDDTSGTVILSTSLGKRDLLALVNGEIEQVLPGRGVVIRTVGTRIYGIAGFGTEAIGELVVGADRPDRELTSDNVSDDWQGKIVLGGMTAGAPALARLKDTGVAGVIVGSIAEDAVRRFLADGQMSLGDFWNPLTAGRGDLTDPSAESSMVVIVTEGFGRRSMNARTFEVLHDSAGQTISASARTSLGSTLARPEIFLRTEEGSPEAVDDTIEDGRLVRLVDTGAIGVSGHATGSSFSRADRYGRRQVVANIKLESGEVRSAPVQNIEVVE